MVANSKSVSINPSGTSRIFFGWWVVLSGLIGLTLGASTVTLFSFGVFITPLEQEFGWSRAQIAFGATIISYMAMFIAPLQGVLIDRYGPRRIVLLSIPVFCFAFAMMYFLPANIYVFYAAWIVIPLCGVGIWPASYSKAASVWFNRRLGVAIGTMAAGVGVGAAIMPVLGQALIGALGWRLAYPSIALITLVITLPMAALFFFDKPADKGLLPDGVASADPKLAGAAPALSGMAYSEAVRTRNFWLLLAMFFLLGIVSTGIIVHHIPMLIDSGLPPQRAAGIMSIFGIAMIVGRLGTGFLLDRFFAPHVTIVYLLGGIAAFALYANGASGLVVPLCAALLGLVVGAEFDFLGYIIKRYFGTRAYGRIYGSLFALFQFGGSLGAISLGVIKTKTGAYAPGLWAFAGLCVLAAIICAALGRYTANETEASAKP
jgi:predicted MFS family arabinose efflux permease